MTRYRFCRLVLWSGFALAALGVMVPQPSLAQDEEKPYQIKDGVVYW